MLARYQLIGSLLRRREPLLGRLLPGRLDAVINPGLESASNLLWVRQPPAFFHQRFGIGLQNHTLLSETHHLGSLLLIAPLSAVATAVGVAAPAPHRPTTSSPARACSRAEAASRAPSAAAPVATALAARPAA